MLLFFIYLFFYTQSSRQNSGQAILLMKPLKEHSYHHQLSLKV